MTSVGISDLAAYAPRRSMSVERLIAIRSTGNRKLGRLLQAAARSTGQAAFRYPAPWEDPVTMAAEAARRLLDANPGLDLARLRYLAAGSETGVDMSKPIAAYVQGLLTRAGRPVPKSLGTFQAQHACAGATVALTGIAALLAASGRSGESGLVLCTDIARYEAGGTAEITQGAGAVAVLVQPDPRLLVLDLDTIGLHSDDVDDFFRPIGSETARVKGGYSIHCYQESLEGAFADHCRRRGQSPSDVLRSTDLFALHAPFRNMPEIAMKRLLHKHLGLEEAAARQLLAERGLFASVEAVSRIGNIYSGSLYLALAFLLADRLRALGGAIVGKRLLAASYGSGNTTLVMSGTVAAAAPQVIGRWNLDGLLAGELAGSIESYQGWLASPEPPREYAAAIEALRAGIPAGAFFLAGIREDGYREYAVR